MQRMVIFKNQLEPVRIVANFFTENFCSIALPPPTNQCDQTLKHKDA